MPNWVAEAVATFAISAVSAYVFLLLRCRGTGYPLGPRSRWWAITVVLATAVAATGIGVAAVAISDHLRAIYIAVIVPSSLCLGKPSSASRRGSKLARRLLGYVAVPLEHLDDCMGSDLQHWCDERSAVAAKNPELINDLADHYYIQVAGQVKDRRKREDLDNRIASIRHKAAVAAKAKLGVSTDVLEEDLQGHSSTRESRGYAANDAVLLSRRLESDAQNELNLLLARIYLLGYRNLVTYLGYKRIPQPKGEVQPK
jgi:hypothetical protein